MKKWIWLSLTAAGLAAAAAIGFGVHYFNKTEKARLDLDQSLRQAEQLHETLSDRYHDSLKALERSRLTATEDGKPVGQYSLADLGLADTARAAVTDSFADADRLSASDFAALPKDARLETLSRADFEPAPAPIALDDLDLDPVLKDLRAVSRKAAVDCKAVFTGSGFTIEPEIPGTQLDEARVLDALTDALTDLAFTGEPLELSFELTSCDPYIPPKITRENQSFDLNALLDSIIHNRNYKLHVDLRGTELTLDADACAALLEVDADGKLCMKRDSAAAYVESWAEAGDADRVPYYFSSYSAGKVTLPFAIVNCRLEKDAMLDRMDDALCSLSTDVVDAPFECTDWAGRSVSNGGTYIEVDIARQTMSAFRDGKLVVSTPVVSGRPSGHMTPPGYYRVLTKNGERWLTGPDYSVFVHYWLGFYDAYGIHDAMWRSVFGGELYKTNGSHGCVNTPTEAMEMIWNNFDIDTPVLVFNIP